MRINQYFEKNEFRPILVMQAQLKVKYGEIGKFNIIGICRTVLAIQYYQTF